MFRTDTGLVEVKSSRFCFNLKDLDLGFTTINLWWLHRREYLECAWPININNKTQMTYIHMYGELMTYTHTGF